MVQDVATEPGRARSPKCRGATGRSLDLCGEIPLSCLREEGVSRADKRPWQVGARVAADRIPVSGWAAAQERRWSLGQGGGPGDGETCGLGTFLGDLKDWIGW